MDGRVDLDAVELLPCKYGELPGGAELFPCYLRGTIACGDSFFDGYMHHTCTRAPHPDSDAHAEHWSYEDVDGYLRWRTGGAVYWNQLVVNRRPLGDWRMLKNGERPTMPRYA